MHGHSAQGVRVCKFGGTSLADAAQFRNVRAIVEADPARRFVVPSAPGKRSADDEKVTDLLYACWNAVAAGRSFAEPFGAVRARFEAIARELALDVELRETFEAVERRLPHSGADYAASRGEAIGGLLLARFLGYEYVDAGDVVRFDATGRLDLPTTERALRERLGGAGRRAVVPGFYGSMPDGRIKTFSRGGSDITGAIVARACDAAVYENWTDVPGLLMADPRIVANPRTIEVLTYAELRELSYMGATVFHTEAVFPVLDIGVPIHIRDVNQPDHSGTLIVPRIETYARSGVTGIAGRRGFTIVTLTKTLMNEERGFGRRLLQVVEREGISFDQVASSIDSMSIVMDRAQVTGRLDSLLSSFHQEFEPDGVDVSGDIALIATVGRGMAHRPGIAARVFAALAGEQINVRMIAQGSSEMNIIVGVQDEDYARAIRAIYAAFVD